MKCLVCNEEMNSLPTTSIRIKSEWGCTGTKENPHRYTAYFERENGWNTWNNMELDFGKLYSTEEFLRRIKLQSFR